MIFIKAVATQDGHNTKTNLTRSSLPSNGPSQDQTPPDKKNHSYEEMKQLLESDPVWQLEHKIVEPAPTGFWQRLWNGPFYLGKNALGEKVYKRVYGGTIDVGMPSGEGFKYLFELRSARSWENLFQWGKKTEVLLKLANISVSDVKRLKDAGVTLEQLKIWSASYAQAIGKVSSKSNAVAKWRMDLVNKLIELW
jgi:hypothetical protein